jgi:hypothetical protein
MNEEPELDGSMRGQTGGRCSYNKLDNMELHVCAFHQSFVGNSPRGALLGVADIFTRHVRQLNTFHIRGQW